MFTYSHAYTHIHTYVPAWQHTVVTLEFLCLKSLYRPQAETAVYVLQGQPGEVDNNVGIPEFNIFQ